VGGLFRLHFRISVMIWKNRIFCRIILASVKCVVPELSVIILVCLLLELIIRMLFLLVDNPCGTNSRYFTESSIEDVMNAVRSDSEIPGVKCATHFNYNNKGVVIFNTNLFFDCNSFFCFTDRY